jgi:opacity protein-like surface antigen
MRTLALLSSLAVLAVASPAAAQFGTVQEPPKTWVSGWVGGYLNPGIVRDGQTGNWDFNSAFAGGVGLHRNISPAVSLGIEGSFSPASYKRVDNQAQHLGSGNARIMTGMVSGRLYTGGTDAFGMYVTGGAGAIVYKMPEIGRSDPDLALHTGAGLEFRPGRRQALFVEWGRFWTFHQKDGLVGNNDVRHQQLKAGVRIGL